MVVEPRHLGTPRLSHVCCRLLATLAGFDNSGVWQENLARAALAKLFTETSAKQQALKLSRASQRARTDVASTASVHSSSGSVSVDGGIPSGDQCPDCCACPCDCPDDDSDAPRGAPVAATAAGNSSVANATIPVVTPMKRCGSRVPLAAPATAATALAVTAGVVTATAAAALADTTAVASAAAAVASAAVAVASAAAGAGRRRSRRRKAAARRRENEWQLGVRGRVSACAHTLKNEGNTCFANAVLQILVALQPLRSALANHAAQGCV